MPETRKTVCAHDCPDACSVLVTVEGAEGSRRAARFRGDPDHPFTRGFLCGKVHSYQRVVHSADRLLHPLRRTGPKGSGRFERIGWEEAIAAAARAIEEARAHHGGESVAQYYYAGTMGLVNRFAPIALFHRIGATRLRPNICFYGADAGYRLTVGSGYGVDPEDIVHSDLIVVWGANVVSTQVHLVPFIDEARRRGARLVVVDPYRNRTVRRADQWVRVRPGTDTALALAMMHVVERDGLLNRDFIERRTLGFEALSKDVLPKYAPARAEAITGIPGSDIEHLARCVARARAPLFKVGIGIGRSSHGAACVRAICSLAGTVGSYEKLGGGVQYDTGCEFGLDIDAITRPDWLERPTRMFNMTDIGAALTEWDSPPVKVLFVHSANPAATAPVQEKVLEGLRRKDLFTIVHERFLTDTARHADIVLPAVTFVESSDLFKSYGHLYLQFAQRVIEPLGECRTNLEVTQALGRALGFDDPWFEHSIEDHVRALLSTDHPNFRGIDPDRVLRGKTVRLNIPRGVGGFRERFATPSGKLEFVSRELVADGLPAVVDYHGDPFNTDPEMFPLRLLTPPAHSFLNASFGGDPEVRRREGGNPSVMIHPEDAGEIEDGEGVELYNDLGRVRLVARVTEDTQPGVLVAEGTWWPSHTPGGRGINALTSSRLTDLGGGSTFHDNRVALRKVAE